MTECDSGTGKKPLPEGLSFQMLCASALPKAARMLRPPLGRPRQKKTDNLRAWREEGKTRQLESADKNPLSSLPCLSSSCSKGRDEVGSRQRLPLTFEA